MRSMQLCHYVFLLCQGWWLGILPLVACMSRWHAASRAYCCIVSVCCVSVSLCASDTHWFVTALLLAASLLAPLFPPEAKRSRGGENVGGQVTSQRQVSSVGPSMRSLLRRCRYISTGSVCQDCVLVDQTVLQAFPFVPVLLQERLCGIYADDLSELLVVLSWAGVAEARLWQDFAIEVDRILEECAHDSDAEVMERPLAALQVLSIVVDEYVVAFAHLVLAHSCVSMEVVSDNQRKRQLQSMGKSVGTSNGFAHNCLIHAILQVLVLEAEVLPAADLAEDQEVVNLCAACREALVSLPASDARRPMARDGEGRVRTDPSDAYYVSAHLQSHLHASFVVDFLLSALLGPHQLPYSSVRLQEYPNLMRCLGKCGDMECSWAHLFGGRTTARRS